MSNKFKNYEYKNLQEACGVFGVINTTDASYKIYLGLHALQHRGQDASGIVTFEDSKPIAVKKPSNVITTFTENDIKLLKGNIGTGHVRYPTFGLKNSINNIQPFIFKDKNNTFFTVCHNGNLTNYETLKKELLKYKTKFQSNSDSEIIGHLLLKSKQATLKDKLIEVLNQIKGAFSYIINYSDCLIGIRDRGGIRPLVIGKNNRNEYIIASETVALDVNNFKFDRNVKPGEVIIINNKGEIESFFYTKDRLDAMCAMEYIYFARPDSILDNQNVHIIRQNLGKQLAIEKPIKADIVIGVPDSSLSAALGYSKQSKIPYEYGLIKNRYIGRSFIAPSQAEREKMIKMKLNFNKSVIQNKEIILVDDSIVRGNTMKGLVKLLKEVGAKKIHVRISSPEIKFPSFYGINIQDKNELALFKQSKAEYQKTLKYVDSLEFLSLDGLEKVIGRSHKDGKLDTSCFNGYYAIELCDYEKDK